MCIEGDCWASQNTDNYRVSMYNLLNGLRANISRGICTKCNPKVQYSNMFEMVCITFIN